MPHSYLDGVVLSPLFGPAVLVESDARSCGDSIYPANADRLVLVSRGDMDWRVVSIDVDIVHGSPLGVTLSLSQAHRVVVVKAQVTGILDLGFDSRGWDAGM